jgi:microcystin-dependent protein
MAFPNSFTAAVDAVTTVAAALLNQLETKVGVNNSTDPNSLDYKINHLISSLTGVILPFGATTPPTGFLLCDGSAVSRTTYATLFGVIGTTYGVGNGSTTFNVPDFRQRFPLGKAVSGTGSTLGGVGGTIDVPAPAHSHTLLVSSGPGGGESLIQDSAGLYCNIVRGQDTKLRPVTDTTGGAGTTNPPFQTVNYIIKY